MLSTDVAQQGLLFVRIWSRAISLPVVIGLISDVSYMERLP